MNRMTIGLSGLFLGLFGAGAQAGITNPGFESGILSGWSTLGYTGVSTAAFGSGPTEGLQAAFLGTGSTGPGSGSPALQATIESAAGLIPGTLDSMGNGNAIAGSLIYQTITANAGDRISFDWNFLTDETAFDQDPTTFNDFSFVSIVSDLGAVELADTGFGTLGSSSTVFNSETGFMSFTHIFSTSGSFTLAFGVMDAGDTSQLFTSGLQIDNLVFTPIPLPHPAALAGLGLVGFVSMRRDRRMV